MKRLSLNTLVLLFIISTSCNNSIEDENKSSITMPISDNSVKNIKTLPILDSTIILSNLTGSRYKGSNSAKIVLYNYAKKKGYLTSDNLPDLSSMTDEESRNLSIDYDTIYTINLNSNAYLDAVITYWLTPLYANGHCWLPHKAIILDSDNGYIVTNEEFIPPNYIIDSISTIDNQVTLFGYEYRCGDNKELRRLKLKLK